MRLAVWILAAAPWLGETSEPVRIEFTVAEGVRLRKTFDRQLELKTREAETPSASGTWSDSQRVVIVDEYGPLEGQVPESITRSFERVEMEHSHGWELNLRWGGALSGTLEREEVGELVGRRVAFTRDRSEAEVPFGMGEAGYRAALVDAPDAPREFAARAAKLRAWTDSTGLLPWRPVAIGDHWYVDVDTFHEVCWPSGALRFVDPQGEALVTPVDERLGEGLDGTFRVELVSVEEQNGVRFARMKYRGILESKADFPYEWSMEFDIDDGLLGSFGYDGRIELELYADLEGDFWWNLDAGHLDTIRLRGEVTVLQDFGEGYLDVMGYLLPSASSKREWTGKLEARAEFERIDGRD